MSLITYYEENENTLARVVYIKMPGNNKCWWDSENPYSLLAGLLDTSVSLKNGLEISQ